MKKANTAIAALFSALLLFSCNKKNTEGITTQNESKPQDVKVPHFDENNSTTITWDRLPEALRNAKPIENQDDNTAGSVSSLLPSSGSSSTSSYSYYSYSVGPWGGWGGWSFYIKPPSGSRIFAMAIRSGIYIDRLTVWYMKADGSIEVGGDVGGGGGAFYLQYFSAGEYIYQVSGRSGGLLDRLSIYTNYKSFSYGGGGGSPFSVSVPWGYQVLGFWGRSGGLIDQLGVYVYTL